MMKPNQCKKKAGSDEPQRATADFYDMLGKANNEYARVVRELEEQRDKARSELAACKADDDELREAVMAVINSNDRLLGKDGTNLIKVFEARWPPKKNLPLCPCCGKRHDLEAK